MAVSNDSAPKLNTLDGYWILASFQDSAIQYKSIARFRLQRPFWTAYIIRITQDSIFTNGSIMLTKHKRLNQGDTILEYETHGHFKLIARKNHDSIYIHQLKEGNKSYPFNCMRPFVYRRLSQEEKSLLTYSNSIERNQTFVLQQAFRRYYSQKVLCGTYKSMQGLQNLVFHENESVTGLEGFNKYYLNDYFGTLHPFNENDVLVFRDTTNTQKAPRYFAWQFKNDQFILQEMANDPTKNQDFDRKGEKLVFKKQ